MTFEAIKRLIFVAGITLLLAISIVLPLRAAPLLHPTSYQGVRDIAWQAVTTTTPTVMPTLTITVAPTIITPTTIFTTPTLTSTPSPTPTTPPTESPTPTKAPAITPEPTNTSTPPDTPVSEAAPTVAPTPTPIPSATPALSIIEQAQALLSQKWSLALLLCLVPLLLLGLLAILWAMRRKPKPPPPPPPPPVVTGAYLESVDTAGEPRRFGLNPEGVTIGRAPENGLVITQDFVGWETVSRQHARVYKQTGRWIVEDLDSMNGVYVDGGRTGRNLLREGWRLGIGGVEFIFYPGKEEARQ